MATSFPSGVCPLPDGDHVFDPPLARVEIEHGNIVMGERVICTAGEPIKTITDYLVITRIGVTRIVVADGAPVSISDGIATYDLPPGCRITGMEAEYQPAARSAPSLMGDEDEEYVIEYNRDDWWRSDDGYPDLGLEGVRDELTRLTRAIELLVERLGDG